MFLPKILIKNIRRDQGKNFKKKGSSPFLESGYATILPVCIPKFSCHFQIINGVIRCLNATYKMFVKNNPGFNGSVSIFAHSLGSVIAYDIITNWSPLLLYDEFVTNAIVSFLS
jgi:hypothetical protein